MLKFSVSFYHQRQENYGEGTHGLLLMALVLILFLIMNQSPSQSVEKDSHQRCWKGWWEQALQGPRNCFLFINTLGLHCVLGVVLST